MSVRIYQLSKQLGKENKEVITILKGRGYEVGSASSTISNIDADALCVEFGAPTFSETEALSKEVETVKETPPPPKKTVVKEVKTEVSPIVVEVIVHKETPPAVTASKPTGHKHAPMAPPPPASQAAPKTPPVPTAPISRPPSSPSDRFVKSADDVKPADKPAPVVTMPPTKQAVVNKAPAVKAPPTPPPVTRSAPKPPSIPQQSATASAPKTPSIPSVKPPPVPAPAPIPSVRAPQPAPAPAPKPKAEVTKNTAPAIPNLAGKAPSLPPQASKAPAIPSSDSTEEISNEEGTPIVATVVKPDLKIISLKPPIVVRDFANELGLKPFKLISELMEMGIFASINQSIEEDIAGRLAERHGFMLEVRHRISQQQEAPKVKVVKPVVDESAFLEPRPPVVCVLGHVDHGKTTLLDAIRKANVVAGEAGGITQHIGAYQVEHNKHKITFLDTPGHAAFSKIRERGAKLTDIAILVVAADDGFMPQTDEALKFAQKSNVPVVVAINKKDAKGANIDRVKQQMQQRNIASEDWGGETLCVPLSALKGEGIDELLDSILLQAEILELKANPKCAAEGVIVESQMEVGRGSTATVIVQKGTLKVGDAIVCGINYCKARAIENDKGERIKEAPPSTPVSIHGWSDTPRNGAPFRVVKNEREAKSIAEEFDLELKRQVIANREAPQAVTLDTLMNAIAHQQVKTFRALIKADVSGSAEALRDCLEEIKSDKIKIQILQATVGPISKNDVAFASASGATIVGFNVKQETGVLALAKHNDIQIIQHSIIYELIDQVKATMAELIEPEKIEQKLGSAEVRMVFTIAKGTAAGCMVTEGRIQKDAFARVHRKNELIHEGRIGTLKRFKDDVTEVRAGYECGIKITGFNDYQVGDILECFEIKLITPEL